MISEPHRKWIEANGDSTLRLNYDLNSDSVVVDAGGYRGEWCAAICAKYSPNVYVFEPVKSCYETIVSKFSSNPKVKVYDLGLSDKDEIMDINISADSSSVYGSGGQGESIALINFIKFIDDNKIEHIDLMKINIEGGEYNLIEALIRSGKIGIVKNIQVQFHSFVDNAVQRRNAIRFDLQRTHELTYDYEFIWENWRKKD